MATYIAYTTSNDPSVTDTDAIQTVLEDWAFIPMHGKLEVGIRESSVDDGQYDHLTVYGEAEFQPYRADEVDHPDEQYEVVDAEGFLTAIAPYLEETLVVQTIAHTKLRWPFGMRQAIVDPETGRVAIEDSYDWREHMYEQIGVE